jgi:hypothetical protein
VTAWKPCAHGNPDGTTCGSFDDVHLYPCGHRCATHSPAAVHGRAVPTPDPELDLVAIQARPRPTPPDRYGTLTTDPLGRTVTTDRDGKRFNDKLPRRPCPRCLSPRGYVPPINHKGDHRDP